MVRRSCLRASTPREECLRKSTKLLSLGITLLLLTSFNKSHAVECLPDLDNAGYTAVPTLEWDLVPDAKVVGYRVFYKQVGGVWQVLVDLPCDLDYDGVTEVCPHSFTTTRSCPTCKKFEEYSFCVKAFNNLGNFSTDCSNEVSVCIPLHWSPNN